MKKDEKWKRWEHEWETFDETESYQKYLDKKNQDERTNMEMEVHNKLDINYKRTLKTVKFLTKSILGKFTNRSKWKLEVWLEEGKTSNNPQIACGVALVRPKRSTIYAKKIAGNLNEAIRKTLNVVERSVRQESFR